MFWAEAAMSLGDIVSRTDLILRKCVRLFSSTAHAQHALHFPLQRPYRTALHRAARATGYTVALCRYEKYAAKPDAPADRPPAGADKFMDEYFFTMSQIEELSKVCALNRLLRAHGSAPSPWSELAV